MKKRRWHISEAPCPAVTQGLANRFCQNSSGRDQIEWESDFYGFSLQLEVLNGCVQVHIPKKGSLFLVEKRQ